MIGQKRGEREKGRMPIALASRCCINQGGPPGGGGGIHLMMNLLFERLIELRASWEACKAVTYFFAASKRYFYGLGLAVFSS
jgi:hypothetical protein